MLVSLLNVPKCASRPRQTSRTAYRASLSVLNAKDKVLADLVILLIVRSIGFDRRF